MMHLLLTFFVFFSITILSQKPEYLRYNSERVVTLTMHNNMVWIGGADFFAVDRLSTQSNYSPIKKSHFSKNIVSSISFDISGNIWIGTIGDGLIFFNGKYYNNFNTKNSKLPNNNVNTLAIDHNGIIWIGTDGGALTKFDGKNWTIYNRTDADFLQYSINSIAIENSGLIWIGTDGGGLVKFDGKNWTVFNTVNSEIPIDHIRTIIIDSCHNIWLGTWMGLVSFDGVKWTVYDTRNSGLPDNDVCSIAIDSRNNKWVATYSGLAKFNGSDWLVYKKSNSILPSDFVRAVAVDDRDNIWVGTHDCGIILLTPNGLSENSAQALDYNPKSFLLFQNHPNPFNPITRVQFELPYAVHVEIKVFDILGREVTNIINDYLSAGNHSISFDASNLSGGIYIYRIRAGSYSESKKMLLLK